MSAEVTWVVSEVSHGRFSVETEQHRIRVFSDLSGDLTMKSSGEVVQFANVGELIEGAEVLKNALTEQYGGWK